MSETDLIRQVTSFTFTWYTLGSNPCAKCIALNGRVWTDQDIWQPTLDDAQFGPVWDFNLDQPLTHPNCYCGLEIAVEIDLTKLESYQKFQKKWEELKIA